jgi:hypothetical protein
MIIYDLPGIINRSLHFAATANIKAGFKFTGIYPYNRNVFPEEEFLPSYVTDRLTVPKALEHRIAREHHLMRQLNQVLPTPVLPNHVLLTTISFVKCKYPLLPKTLLSHKATAMRGV